MRLLATFLISEGRVQEKTREKLITTASLGAADKSLFDSLANLGVSMNAASLKSKTLSKKKKKKKGEEEFVPYEISRFQPVLRTIVSELLDDTLSTADYPVVAGTGSATSSKKKSKSGQSLRSASTPKWAKRKAEGAANDKAEVFDGARLIIFIAGGVTMSEIRTVYELSAKFKRDIVIVSTHILTPTAMLRALRDMSDGGACCCVHLVWAR